MSAREQREKVLEQKEKVSSKISDLSRFIGFGLVAVVYAILTSDSPAIATVYSKRTTLLLVAACLGVGSILLDYVQFLAGYFSVEKALDNEGGGYNYDPQAFAYKVRRCAFFAKQITAILGSLVFGSLIVLHFV